MSNAGQGPPGTVVPALADCGRIPARVIILVDDVERFTLVFLNFIRDFDDLEPRELGVQVMSAGDHVTPASAESIQRTIQALAARNVEAVLLQSRDEALTKLKELIPEGSEVFVNTSETLTTIGYTEYMHGNDRYVNLHDRMMALPDPAAQAGVPPQDHHRRLLRWQRAGHRRDRRNRHRQRFRQPDRSLLLRRPPGHSRCRRTEDLPHADRSRGPHRGWTLERHDRWLEGRAGRRTHRQVPDHGARAGGGANHDAPGHGELGW